MPLRVLVVDDQALVRAGFTMILNSEADIEVVGEAENGRDAIDQVDALEPDVVLMDIRMPVMDGIAATAIICDSEGPDVPRILMLTTFDLDDHIHAALRAGASGFLLKDTPPDDLINAVRVVAAGDALLAPSVTRRLLEEFSKSHAPGAPHPGVENLTGREMEVLEYLASGLSNAEIADALFVSEATIKTHVSHILTKLDVRDRVQAVVVAYESGLVIPGS
ncbi:MAG: response regulator transcription factor [Actinomycetia bacterium]|nr:response regulator transcription factor [Actinomycetes bacterium]